MRRALSVAFSTLIASTAIAYLCVMLPGAVTEPQDFRAFYCAGSVLGAGQDPYLATPLGRCQDRLIRQQGASPLPGLVVPAPLPGYVLPAFVALSKLPFRVALGLFSLGILCAYSAAGFVLTKMTGCPPYAVAAGLWLCGGLASLTNGQIVPFAFVAACLAAFELQRGNDRRAAIYALGAAIEPHLGIPVLLSLFASAPRSRKPIAIGGAVLIALAIGTLGTSRCAEYLTRVLPAQTHAEIHSSDQYSLTALLHIFGVPDNAALAIGDVQYLATILLAVVFARRIGKTIRKRELLITVPAAFAIVGGPYIHLVQMVFAVPLLLSLATVPRLRRPAAIALLLVAVPWRDVVLNEASFAAIAIALTAIAIAIGFISRRPAIVTLTCAAALAIGGAESLLPRYFKHAAFDATQSLATLAPRALAEDSWRYYEDRSGSYETASVYLAVHAPTSIALLIMVSSTIFLLRPGSRTSRNRPLLAVRAEAR